jgi:3-deoxy-7-phosphoheptulonate synthase
VELKNELPTTDGAYKTVAEGRAAVHAILDGQDPRMLVVVGPCSVHNPDLACEYASRLVALREEVKDSLQIVMRTYFEKPRTTLGWKGLINDPHLDGTYDLTTGLQTARKLLLDLAEMGMPTATEMLDPIVPQYIADLVTWASIGARTTESQTHREMASGLSMPVGFKNSTDGNLQVAINAMLSARGGHHFLGINQEGRSCVVQTRGNGGGHLILRGGGGKPNYDRPHVVEAEQQLQAAGLEPRIMVDCSHANCNKEFAKQGEVMKNVVEQRVNHDSALVGLMLESNLEEGNQKLTDPKDLRHGVSITDPCLGWEATEALIRHAADKCLSRV